MNLTCGRNPWKQASVEDSTYRAYLRSQDFLKTILPLSDELSDILGMIFDRNPEQRITLPELRNKILACSRLTNPVVAPAPLPTPPASPDTTLEYVCEDIIVADYDSQLSAASSSSDEGSTCSSDDGSLTSSGSTIDDLDEDFIQEQQQQQRQEIPQDCPSPLTFDPEEPRTQVFPGQEFVPQHYTGPVPAQVPVAVPEPLPLQVPVPVQVPVPAPVQAPSCAPKPFFPLWWVDMAKYVQQAPALHQHIPFHQQVPIFAALQGC